VGLTCLPKKKEVTSAANARYQFYYYPDQSLIDAFSTLSVWRKLLSTIDGDFGDQDPITSLFFCSEKSAVRRR